MDPGPVQGLVLWPGDAMRALTLSQTNRLATLAQNQTMTGRYELSAEARALWGLRPSPTSSLLKKLTRCGHLIQHSDGVGTASRWEVKHLRQTRSKVETRAKGAAPRYLVIEALRNAGGEPQHTVMPEIPVGRLLMRAAGGRPLGEISDQDLAEALNTLAARYRAAYSD